MLKKHLFVALRSLLKNKGFSTINILGLAVGMICCIVILQQVRQELSFDSFHKNSDRLYRLNVLADFTGNSPINAAVSAGPMAPALFEQFPEVENFARIDFGYIPFYEQDKKIQIEQVLFADHSLLEMFDFELAAGNRNTALKETHTAVVTEETAQKLFGNENPVGKILKGNQDYTITGVLKNIPESSHLQFDMLLSMTERVNGNGNNIKVWETFNFRSYILLKENADPKDLESKIPEFVKPRFSSLSAKLDFYLQPLEHIHLHSMHLSYDFNYNKSDIAYVYIFGSIAVIVLLIACINFMNLSTARSAKRATEVGIRKVVGANRRQLFFQFLGESLLITTIALMVAVTFIEFAKPVFSNYFSAGLSFNIFSDWLLIVLLVGIIFIVSFLAGGYPAFVLSTFQPKETLKGFTSPGGKGEFLRKLLVASQFVVAIFLLTSAGFISSQLNYIQNKNLGYNKEQVVISAMGGEIRNNYETFREILLQNPAITGVAASEFQINNILSRSIYRIKGDSKETQRLASNMRIDYDFIPFFELELVEGRNFSREFKTDTDKYGGYIINESLRDQLGWETAVGKKFGRIIDLDVNDSENLGTIIGVVKDFNFESLHDKIGPLYIYMDSNNFEWMSIRIRPENIQSTLVFIEEEWAKFDLANPFDGQFLDDEFAMAYQNEERVGLIVKTFTVLAIFVTCLGLLGLISFFAERRTKEIGIRKTLGASTSSIIVLLTKEISWLVILSNIVAWPIAWYAVNQWLQNFAYRVDVTIWPFLLSGLAAFMITLLTILWQATRAANANPIKSLKCE